MYLIVFPRVGEGCSSVPAGPDHALPDTAAPWRTPGAEREMTRNKSILNTRRLKGVPFKMN